MLFKTIMANLLSPKNTTREAAYRKLNLAAHVVRALTACYAIFTLWQFLTWWLNKPRIIQMRGRYWGLDLSEMASWQPMVGLGMNFIAWVLLVISVAYAWKFFASFKRDKGLSAQGGQLLMRCAWFAVACFVFTVLSRPIFNYFLTIHLDSTLRVLAWEWQMRDLMRAILTLALLMFAYVYSWMLDIAEENKGFV
jgi:hypothetical protein